MQPTSPPIDVIVDDSRRHFCRILHAGGWRTGLYGKAGRTVVAEESFAGHHLESYCDLFVYFVAGTGHVAYSVLPVIAEVATETKIRPEMPLGIAVIASQQAITASPISAATVALLGLLAGFDVTLFDIPKITIPATIIG